jgi:hypothetical protein
LLNYFVYIWCGIITGRRILYHDIITGRHILYHDLSFDI